MIVFDFCNTLVPFNTSQTYFEFIGSKNIWLRIILIFRKFLSVFRIYITEKSLLFFIKKYFPRLHKSGLSFIREQIRIYFNYDLFNNILVRVGKDHRMILSTATFKDFVDNSILNKYFDIILASETELNSSENKVKNLLPFLRDEDQIIFVSDSFTEDTPMFLFSDKRFYIVDNQIYEF